MKNILKNVLIILTTFSIILSLNITSRAIDGTPRAIEGEPRTVEENSEINPVSLTNDIEDLKKNKNMYNITSENITISEKINGDVYLISSGTVTIDSTIMGNAFIIASNINVTENGLITSAFFTIAENLEIAGTINGNVYSVASDFNLKEKGTLFLDLFSVSENSTIAGTIYRDVNAVMEKIELGKNAHIEGDFNYTSESQLEINNEVVLGKVNFTPSKANMVEVNEKKNDISSKIFDILSFTILVLIVFAICKCVNCKIANSHNDFDKNIVKYILFGFLGLFVIPILSILLMIFVVTIPLAFVLLAFYLIALLLASTILVIVASNFIAEKIQDKFSMNDSLLKTLCIIVLCIAYKLLQLVPVIGNLLTFVVILTGIGILLTLVIPAKKIETV